METTNQYLDEVAITAIIVKEDKYLIMRRSVNKKRFPGMWTVPGGKMESADYLKLPKDTKFYWYNVLERTLKREVREESKDYELIDGIYDELVMAENHRKGIKMEWKRS